MRVSEQFLRTVDDWRRSQTDLPSRAEAIRRLGICRRLAPAVATWRPPKLCWATNAFEVAVTQNSIPSYFGSTSSVSICGRAIAQTAGSGDCMLAGSGGISFNAGDIHVNLTAGCTAIQTSI